MTYTNFLSGQLSSKGTVGKKAWEWGKSQGFSDQQLKVAVQQLAQAGVGVNNAPGQFFNNGGPMRGVAGIASPKNPLGKYQGRGGNLGLNYYTQARNEFSASEIGELLPASGMYLPQRAQTQWNFDMQRENQTNLMNAQREAMDAQNAAMRDQMDSMLAMYEKKNSTVSKAAPYSVGTGGNASLKAADASKKKSKSNVRSDWNRGGAGFQSSLNTGAASSVASSAASKSLNV